MSTICLPRVLKKDEEIWHYYPHAVFPYELESRSKRAGKSNFRYALAQLFENKGNNYREAMNHVERLKKAFASEAFVDYDGVFVFRRYINNIPAPTSGRSKHINVEDYPIFVKKFVFIGEIKKGKILFSSYKPSPHFIDVGSYRINDGRVYSNRFKDKKY